MRALALLAAAALAVAAPALAGTAVTLKADTVSADAVVTLGDLFDGAGAAAATPVATRYGAEAVQALGVGPVEAGAARGRLHGGGVQHHSGAGAGGHRRTPRCARAIEQIPQGDQAVGARHVGLQADRLAGEGGAPKSE